MHPTGNTTERPASSPPRRRRPGATRAASAPVPGVVTIETPEGSVKVKSIGEILREMLAEKGAEGVARDVARLGAQPPEPLTWEMLCQREPHLLAIERLAIRARDEADPESRCGAGRWYGFDGKGLGFKQLVSAAVGWRRPGFDEHLSTTAAFNLVVARIYGLMPDCRGPACGCL